jgi:hypothetical protein
VVTLPAPDEEFKAVYSNQQGTDLRPAERRFRRALVVTALLLGDPIDYAPEATCDDAIGWADEERP